MPTDSTRMRTGEMAAGMAHELNQPLAGVRGIAEQLLIGMERGWETSDGALKEQLEINPFSLEEVVLNLLNNARDAVEEAERAEGGEERVVKVSTRGAAAGVEVVVEDRGAGIPRMPPEWTSTGPLKRTKWRRSGF